MYLSFDRYHMQQRQPSTSMQDATGTPFTTRSTPDAARSNTERRDYREQADGAP